MNKEKTTRVLNYLEELFPDAYCELNHDSDFQLLVAVMLSAQTTDKKVNELTKDLFKKYPDIKIIISMQTNGLVYKNHESGIVNTVTRGY